MLSNNNNYLYINKNISKKSAKKNNKIKLYLK
jgi:hypothetical protein